MKNYNWVVYLLKSTDSSSTYVGATIDIYKRLVKHNTYKGAKYTKGQYWYVVLVITGFKNKNSCLSFETGWHKINKRKKKFIFKNYYKGNLNRIKGLYNLLHLGNLNNKWESSDLTIHFLENINIPKEFFLPLNTNINKDIQKMPFMNI